jgi:hypothetical protein
MLFIQFINESLICFSVLQVGLTLEVSSAGIEALSKLSNLQQFIFGRYMEERDWKHEARFFTLCIEYLPHLRAAGHSIDIMDAIECQSHGLKRGYHSHLLNQLKQPATLSLQLLDLADDVLPAKKIKFAGLEELVLWNPSRRSLDWCDSYTSVTSVGLYQCSNIGIAPVLNLLCQFGERLHSLVLHDVFQQFSLAAVLLLCPRLKRFKVSNCKLDRAPEKCPEAVFICMEEACLEHMKLPPGFIKQVN